MGAAVLIDEKSIGQRLLVYILKLITSIKNYPNSVGCSLWTVYEEGTIKTEKEFKRKLIEKIGYDDIQLVTISRPSAYGEYEPYHFVDTEEEFEKQVVNM